MVIDGNTLQMALEPKMEEYFFKVAATVNILIFIFKF
jgi:hypothetical protein